MAAGVVGMSGVNARKSVGLVIKYEIGFATAQSLLEAAIIAMPMVLVIQNPKYATTKVVQVRQYAIEYLNVEK